MKKSSRILAGLAFLGLLIFLVVPNQEFYETLFPLRENTEIVVYDDQADGGNSVAQMTLLDSSLVLECKLNANTGRDAWCGLIWTFTHEKEYHYQNWTFVDSLILETETMGISEILIKVWTYDPDVTLETDKKTFRLLIKEVPLKEGQKRIAIPFESFYTPDYWYTQTKTNRNLTKRHQETVAKVEITPGWHTPRDSVFRISIRNFSAKGVSNVPFGILLAYLTILMMAAIGLRQKK
ncbi:MAG: hypothetical protein LBR60_08500 [Fibrobacter sp.]|jgi:hypothetical protein|nr:hypothetical protein [Fibrobacter sp.]